MKDSAGTERTVEEVRKAALETAHQMGERQIMQVLVDEVGGWENLPADFTRCDCHGLWYDQCEVYR